MRKIAVASGGRGNPAGASKRKPEALGFSEWLVVIYWNAFCAYGLSAFWTGPCGGNWGLCPEQEAAKAIAAGFWLVVGLIVAGVALRATPDA